MSLSLRQQIEMYASNYSFNDPENRILPTLCVKCSKTLLKDVWVGFDIALHNQGDIQQ